MTNHSLANRFHRVNSFLFLALGLAMSVLISFVAYYNTKQFRDRQVQSTFDAFPQSIVSNLIESDYIPIGNKLALLRESGLFSDLAIFDKSGEVIRSFGAVDQLGPEFLAVTDSVGNVWGKIGYRLDDWTVTLPFLISSIIGVALTLLSVIVFHWVSKRHVSREFNQLNNFLSHIEKISADIAQTQKSPAILLTERTANISGYAEPERIQKVITGLGNEIQSYAERNSNIQIDLERERANAKFVKLAKQVAHDIRSPVSALRTIASLLGHENHEQKKLLKMAIDRVQKIANDLLETSREEKPASVDLNALAERLVKEKQFEYHNFKEFELIRSNRESLKVGANESELERVVSNVLNNAAEAAPVKIRITTKSDDQFTYLTVEDDGKGFDPLTMDKLGREMFTDKTHGNGIGLLDAHQKVKKWNSKIELGRSSLGGALVRIAFPRA